MRKGRPPRSTAASPSASISGRAEAKFSVTCEGSKGAPMVATARADGIASAARSTAAPPSEWPIRSDGAIPRPSRWRAAASRSATLEVKVVLANSPPEWPSPVKSKRITAMPCAASRPEMRRAATMSLPQVKQWAKSAVASVGPSGRSSRAASVEPSWPGKERRSVVMAAILACVGWHPGGRGAGPQHAPAAPLGIVGRARAAGAAWAVTVAWDAGVATCAR